MIIVVCKFTTNTILFYCILLFFCFNKTICTGLTETDFFFQVNISSSWLLPQNEFPVFYRHFRDRVTWFEADAVCQFHHAQLATGKSVDANRLN